MRCRSCDKLLSRTSPVNEHTGELDDLCPTCRGEAYFAADTDNYTERVPENYRWPAKRVLPDE